MPPAAVRAVAVVIPVRDEEALLAACLESVAVARGRLAEHRPEVRSTVVVVLDRCTDGSAAIAAAAPGVQVLVSHHGQVGAARAQGVGWALARWTGRDAAAATWIANTDADSLVPASWLLHHLGTADGGADLLLGTVRPQPADLPAPALAAWRARHPATDGHPRVHGANLGVRGSAYVAAGGFPDVAEHEDVRLVEQVRARGGLAVASAGDPVTTSGRTTGRTPGGFAGYLRALTVPVPPVVAAQPGPVTADG
ncbi:glycosyl transferase [Nakamurella endophytica]|uniref:4,4'-diaponeurosporenoate glycosyltransferase n=1 Tax=Nakamurella endophytica TaxID=1748367 RepID=A0A917SUQ3_9ACTN|nr:glycosyl transferase [Nakamurella endophytica]